MKFVIQRVLEASVRIGGETTASIGKGYLVLVGIAESDTAETADKMIRKLMNLRIFDDGNGKTNLNLSNVGGELLIVSQFTLYADCRKGNRPSFTGAGSPDKAETLYQYMISECKKLIPATAHGEFGADMKVSLVNDGPFTIILDSDVMFQAR